MMLKKGTEVYLSELGHYNFLYPDRSKKVLLGEDVNATRMSFLSGESESLNKLTAFEIKDIINNTKGKIIVWL